MIPEIPAKKKSKRFIIPASFYSNKIVEEVLDQKRKPKENIIHKVTAQVNEAAVSVKPEKTADYQATLPKRGRSILSLKSLTQQKTNKKKKAAINYDELPKSPFTKEQFTTLWKKNIEKLNGKNEKLLASLLNSISFNLVANFKVELTLPNTRMQQEIEKNKGKILNYFREELQNYAIDFVYVVNEAEAKKFAYTPQEKYQFLKEKNPLISELRRKLDLDV